MKSIKLTKLKSTCHRLINSRFPTIGVFDDLHGLEPEDVRFAFELEMATSGRATLPRQRLQLLPENQYVTGDTASIIMAAFLHADEAGGRFSDARMGAWYAALNLQTAISEVQYHNHRRLKASKGGFPCSIQMRELICDIDCDLIDLRGEGPQKPELYHLTDYTQSQKFAAYYRWEADDNMAYKGVVFDSVRKAGGTNICLWWPKAVPQPVIQGRHIQIDFNSTGVASHMELSELKI
ncbi:MAG: RES family NAD+ phosphorylase [Alphaproteobacteria bacterium]